MKPKTPRSNSGVHISGNVSDVVVANGENAYATNTVQVSGGPPVDLGPIERELAALRARLAQWRESGTAEVSAEALAAAEGDTEALQRQVRSEQPDPDEITRHLGRLTVVLGGIAGVTETLARLSQAVARLVGLG
jgi:hypothetical protein